MKAGSYVKDDDLDREGLARNNRDVLLANGVEPRVVARMLGDVLELCPVCGRDRKHTVRSRPRKTCGRRKCVVYLRSHYPRTAEHRRKLAASVSASRTPEVRARIGAASREHWRDPAYRVRVSAALRAAAQRRSV